jgi:hypothetical protein
MLKFGKIKTEFVRILNKRQVEKHLTSENLHRLDISRKSPTRKKHYKTKTESTKHKSNTPSRSMRPNTKGKIRSRERKMHLLAENENSKISEKRPSLRIKNKKRKKLCGRSKKGKSEYTTNNNQIMSTVNKAMSKSRAKLRAKPMGKGKSKHKANKRSAASNLTKPSTSYQASRLRTK